MSVAARCTHVPISDLHLLIAHNTMMHLKVWNSNHYLTPARPRLLCDTIDVNIYPRAASTVTHALVLSFKLTNCPTHGMVATSASSYYSRLSVKSADVSSANIFQTSNAVVYPFLQRFMFDHILLLHGTHFASVCTGNFFLCQVQSRVPEVPTSHTLILLVIVCL